MGGAIHINLTVIEHATEDMQQIACWGYELWEELRKTDLDDKW
jgi:hypothetical protein